MRQGLFPNVKRDSGRVAICAESDIPSGEHVGGIVVRSFILPAMERIPDIERGLEWQDIARAILILPVNNDSAMGTIAAY